VLELIDNDSPKINCIQKVQDAQKLCLMLRNLLGVPAEQAGNYLHLENKNRETRTYFGVPYQNPDELNKRSLLDFVSKTNTRSSTTETSKQLNRRPIGRELQEILRQIHSAGQSRTRDESLIAALSKEQFWREMLSIEASPQQDPEDKRE